MLLLTRLAAENGEDRLEVEKIHAEAVVHAEELEIVLQDLGIGIAPADQ